MNRTLRTLIGWFAACLACAIPPAAAQRTDIGINPENVTPHSKDKIFADAFKHSRTISTSVDANGWPTTNFSVTVSTPLWNNATNAPWGSNGMQGTYRLAFDGQAQIGTSSTLSVSNQVYDSAANRTTALVHVSEQNSITLNFTNTRRTAGSALNTGVTNIRFMRPISTGSSTPHEFHETFSRSFKQTMGTYGFIRAMDLTATNANILVNWSDRVRPGHATQVLSAPGYGWQGRGIAYEYLILLANETGRDLWFCVPPRASDDFMVKLARLFRYGSDGNEPYASPQSNPVFPPLNPARKLYVEVGNEFWNFFGSTFSVNHNWNNDRARDESYDVNTPIGRYVSRGLYPAGATSLGGRRVAVLGVRASTAFRSVFGDADMMTRIRPVFMSGQDDNGGYYTDGLAFLDDYYNNPAFVSTPRPPSYYFYAIGTSHYFYPLNDSSPGGDVVQVLGDNLPYPTFRYKMENAVAKARVLGLKFMTYEGGFHLDFASYPWMANPPGYNRPYATIAEALFRDSRSREVIKRSHRVLDEAGVDASAAFNTVGGWEFSFYNPESSSDQASWTNSPRLLGLLDVINGSRFPVTFGEPLPAIFDPKFDSTFNFGAKQPASHHRGRFLIVPWNANPSQFGAVSRSSVGFFGRALAAGDFTFAIRYASTQSSSVQLVVDGTAVGTYTLPSTNGSEQTTTLVTRSLAAGQRGFQVKHLSGQFDFRGLVVTSGSGGGGGGNSGNVALGKTASATSQESANPAANAIDGNPATRWSASSGSFPQTLTVALGSAHDLTGVEIMWELAAAWRYRVETSTNGSTWTVALDRTGNASSQQTFTHSFTASGVTHIRLVATGGGIWASVNEFKVFGAPSAGGGGGGGTPTNVALGKSASATSQETANPAGGAIDGSTGTRWSASSSSLPQTLTVNLGSAHDLTGVEIVWELTEAWRYRVETSTNGSTWAIALDRTGNTTAQQTFAHSFTASGVTQIRLVATGGGFWASVLEFRVLGTVAGGGGGGTAPAEIVLETYDPAAAKSSDLHRIFSETTASGGSCAVLEADAAGDFVTYAVPNVQAATYRVFVRRKVANNRGIVQLATADSLGGTYTDRGGASDHYSSAFGYDEVEVGTVTFATSGTKFFRFTVTGKNAASSGHWLAVDRIRLAP
jgi:hypothetical protein